ncbi:hypothetical protein AAUPMB_00355 [Pasteurella multocida subsp. multocida str. Anand1_buffalo]|nr:hypothetical protein AAUPMB_00355 [Pasteurella multocida subsp. multocida str. Anand1_buffalo]
MKKWIVSVILLVFSLGTLAATNAMQLVNDAKKAN